MSVTGKAICPYCGVGCQVNVTVKDNFITALIGAKDSKHTDAPAVKTFGTHMLFTDNA